MPIQQISLGARPKGEGGDTWREGSEKINGNFQNLDERVEHAQSTADEKTKNESDSYLLNRQNHTGTQAISSVAGLSDALNGKQGNLTAGENITIEGGVISAASAQLYDGVDSTSETEAATANSVKTAYDKAVTAQSTADEKTKNESDSYLLNRQNHTGTQAISSVAGLSDALNGKQGNLTAGENITIEGGVISAASAQLYDGVDSTSETEAATANSVKTAYDKAVTAQSTADEKTKNESDSYLLNRQNHTGTQAISSVAGLSDALNGKQGNLTAGDNITIEDGVISVEPVDATTEVKGVTRFATTTEAKTGTDVTIAITPASLLSVLNAIALTANMVPHDVALQRAVNTTYTNTSTGLRLVCVGFRMPTGANVQMLVDGYAQGFVTKLSGSGDEYLSLWGLVPPGKNYRFEVIGGAPVVVLCVEYFV